MTRAAPEEAGSSPRRPSSPCGDGRPIVVKVGGDLLLDDTSRTGLARNLRQLVDAGYPVVVLHGGGPQVSALQEQLGLVPQKIGGRRVTSPADLQAVVQALCGEVNVGLTCALLAEGIRAFGCHGASAGLVRARRRPPAWVPGGGDEPVDFGEVGEVTRVDATLLGELLRIGLVPVIATLGVAEDGGRVYNVNADTTATRIAEALGAAALLLVTGVGGVFRDVQDPTSRLGELSSKEARQLIEEGEIAGGMIPKVEEAIAALQRGVSAIAIVGVGTDGAFLRGVREGGGSGTRITP